MPLKIVQAGELVLRQRAQPLTKTQIRSRDIQGLIESMRETMREAPGVGLAAPQVGVSLQLVVIEDKPEYTKDAPPDFLKERGRKPVPFHVLANPRIVTGSEERVRFFEGCLSLKGFTAVVPRSSSVKVECLDQEGEPRVIEAAGWYARILQHEVDHLNGALYIDRMHTRTFMSVESFNQLWKDKPITEVGKLLGFER
ncbi:MAG: peptide deformylase [Acidobacteriaceae bacterium]|nr:peptide deformylase [Acidobacteriaceae bacterium]